VIARSRGTFRPTHGVHGLCHLRADMGNVVRQAMGRQQAPQRRAAGKERVMPDVDPLETRAWVDEILNRRAAVVRWYYLPGPLTDNGWREFAEPPRLRQTVRITAPECGSRQ
jgi:hypothetical protein